VYIEKYTENKKKPITSLFILLRKAQAVVQETSRKNATSTVFIFFLFCPFEVMGGKITINLKEEH